MPPTQPASLAPGRFARAPIVAPAAADPGLTGQIDGADHARVFGWAWDATIPGRPVRIQILDNDVPVAERLADLLRPDLVQAGFGTGRLGFEYAPAGGLPPGPHVIRVIRMRDGAELGSSPRLIEAVAAVDDAPGAWRGHLDEATRDRVVGWAWNAATPHRAVALQLIVDGNMVARLLADRHRPDLEAHGIGTGRHGFQTGFPHPLSLGERHEIELRRDSDGAPLPGSPWVIEPTGDVDPAAEAALTLTVTQAVTAAVSREGVGPDAAEAQARLLSVLRDQAERLHRRRGGQPASARVAPRGRALVLNPDVPVPHRDAGSEALLSHMRGLQRLGFDVALVATEQMAGAPANTAPLEAEGFEVCAAPFYAAVEEVLMRRGGDLALVYLHRVEMATRYMALARHWCPRARIVFSVADLFHVRLARQAALEDRPELATFGSRVRLAEMTAAWSADAVITHSIAEAGLLRRAVPQATVHVVPWEIATDPTRVPLADRQGVGFLGCYGHPPNVDAARWLVEAVMPLVWAQDPTIPCVLAGSGMPREITGLDRPGIVIAGYLEHLRPGLFDRVRLTVAPLRYPAGVQGKLLASMAGGLPGACTTVAAEGMDLPSVLQGLVAASAEQLAGAILRLHADASLNARAAQAGLEHMDRTHSRQAVDAALARAVLTPEPAETA